MPRGRELSKDVIEHRLKNNDLFLDDIGASDLSFSEVTPPPKRPIGRGFSQGGIFPGGRGLAENRFKLNASEESSIRDRLNSFKKSVETSLYDEDDDVNIDENTLRENNDELNLPKPFEEVLVTRKVELLHTQEESEIAIRLNSLAEEVMADKAEKIDNADKSSAIFPSSNSNSKPDRTESGIFLSADEPLNNPVNSEKSTTFDIFQPNDELASTAPAKDLKDDARSLIDRLMFEKTQLEAELLRQKQKSAGINKTEVNESNKKAEVIETLKLEQPPPPGSIKARLGGYAEEAKEERFIVRENTDNRENRENRYSQKHSSRHKPDEKYHHKSSRRSPPGRTRRRSKSPVRRTNRSPPSRVRSPPPYRPRSPKRNRSRSPRRNRSKSPRHRSRSPRRRTKSPVFRAKSPRRRSKSPRHRSKSPPFRPGSPRIGSKSPRRLKSPHGRYRSRSRSFSLSPTRSPSRKFKRDIPNSDVGPKSHNPISPKNSNDQWMRPSGAPDQSWKGPANNSFSNMNISLDIPPPNFEQPPPLYNYPPQDFGNPAVKAPPFNNFPPGHFVPDRPYFPRGPGPGQPFMPNEGFSSQNQPPGWTPGPGPLGPMNVPPPFMPSGPPPPCRPNLRVLGDQQSASSFNQKPPSFNQNAPSFNQNPPSGFQPPKQGGAPQSQSNPPPDPQKTIEEEKKEKAVESELLEQRKSLALQRSEYYKKAATIKQELGKLKRQQVELGQEKNTSEAEKILKQNKKFQSELQNKLKGIDNIIDMLSGIIGDTKDLNLEVKEPTPPGHSVYIDPPASSKKDSKFKKTSPAVSNPPKPEAPSRSMVLNLDPSPGSDFDSFKFTSQKSIEVFSPRTPAKIVEENSTDAWESEFPERPKSPLGQRLAATNPMVDSGWSKSSPVAEPITNPVKDVPVKTPPPPIFMAVETRAPSPTVIRLESPTLRAHSNKAAPIFDPQTLPTPKPPQVTRVKPDSPVIVQSTTPTSQPYYSQPQPTKQQLLAASQPEAPGTHKPLVNYVHYDPEIHWCKVCNVFPRTAKEYLNHLHAPEHKKTLMDKNMFDAPWHKAFPPEGISPVIPGAPTKRVPIRGLPFFVATSAWYCKLCNVWIGDLHCASLHLKSINHAAKYSDFVLQNPHWEVDWLADRTRAYEITTEIRQKEESEKLALMALASAESKESAKQPLPSPELDAEAEKRKKIVELIAAIEENKKEILKVKKKRPRSSSSDSSSSSSSSSSSDDDRKRSSKTKSKSIRVAMRNRASKHTKREASPSRSVSPKVKPRKKKEASQSDEKEDKMIKEWMTTSDRDLKESVSSLKDRIKSKQESKSKSRYEKPDKSRFERKGNSVPEKPERRPSGSKSNEKDPKKKYDPKEDRRKDEKDDKRRSNDKETKKKNDENVRKREKDVDKEESKSSKPEIERKGGKAASDSEKPDKKSTDNGPFEPLPKQESTPFGTKPIKKQGINIKMKLPFIGRMPFHKKVGGGKIGAKDDKEEGKSDDLKNLTSKEVVSEKLTKIATSLNKFRPDGTLIDPVQAEIQSIMEEKVKEVTGTTDMSKNCDKSDVEDMDLANEDSDDEGNLPKDFQTALDIIFPEEEKPDAKDSKSADSKSDSKTSAVVSSTNQTIFYGPQSGPDMPNLPPAPPPSAIHPTPGNAPFPVPQPGFSSPPPMIRGVPPPIIGSLPPILGPGMPPVLNPGLPPGMMPGAPRMSPPGPPRMSPPGPPRMRPPGPPRHPLPRMKVALTVANKGPDKTAAADATASSEDGEGESKEGQPEVKKRRNPLSQKKRRALKKLREKLEAQEKQLQEQLQNLQNKDSGVANDPANEAGINAAGSDTKGSAKVEQTVDLSVIEIPVPKEPANPPLPRDNSDDLALLGIDATDSHF